MIKLYDYNVIFDWENGSNSMFAWILNMNDFFYKGKVFFTSISFIISEHICGGIVPLGIYSLSFEIYL